MDDGVVDKTAFGFKNYWFQSVYTDSFHSVFALNLECPFVSHPERRGLQRGSMALSGFKLGQIPSRTNGRLST